MKLLDLNKDGKISLEEFNFWWTHGKTSKLEELVWLRMKSLKLSNRIKSKVAKWGGFKHSADRANHSYHFHVG